MKKIGMFAMLTLLLVGLASAAAPTGFYLNKDVVVTGDWKYDGGWQNGVYPTATFDMTVKSPLATEGFYGQNEKLGEAWKYDLKAQMSTNAKTKIENLMQAWTVNDPETTPATGGYTKYKYKEITAGEFSQASLTVNGFGAALVGSNVVVNSPAMQSVEVKIN